MSLASSLPQFIKYESICSIVNPHSIEGLLGDQWEIYEKLDGGNCQIRKTSDGQILVGSRACYLKGRRVDKFPWFRSLVGWAYSNASLYELPEDLIVYGEWLGNHTIEYEPRFTDKFFVLDVFDVNTGKFIPYEEGKKWLNDFGVEGVNFVRRLHRGKISEEIVNGILKGKSNYRDGPMEGVVLKDYSEPQFLKVYHPRFAESRIEKGNVEYVTPTRFSKNYFRLKEEEDVDWVTRARLVEAVIQNIRRETGADYGKKYVAKKLDQFVKDGEFDLPIR